VPVSLKSGTNADFMMHPGEAGDYRGQIDAAISDPGREFALGSSLRSGVEIQPVNPYY
jgi:hypothetical protein